MRIRFGFRWIPLYATIAVVTIGILLGNWQLRRADEKRAIETRMTQRQALPPLAVGTKKEDPAEIEYRHVSVQGEFDGAWPVYLDNRPQAGSPGFYVLMPFKIAGSQTQVLVQRGWVALDPHHRSAITLPPLPAGPVDLQGIAVRNPGHVMQLGEATPLTPGAIVQNVTVEEFATAAKRDMQPFVIEQTSVSQDGLVRDWPLPSAGIDRHLGYAFQWYGLAATAFLFFVVTGFRHGARAARK